ncbi:MAG: ubiquitin carboxyl-terminal hydrolase 14 [Methanosarcina sp.]|jgi:uncharacterized UBP type Zn finger protein
MACTHRDMIKIKDVESGSKGCEECLKMGDSWVHLRICLTCGHVGCCDSSKNKHATKHFEKTGHPVIQSFQPGEDWKYCYIDQEYLE